MCHRGKAEPRSPLTLSRYDQMKSSPLSFPGVEKCRAAPWESSRIRKLGSERVTKDYRELIKLALPVHALYPGLISRKSNWY